MLKSMVDEDKMKLKIKFRGIRDFRPVSPNCSKRKIWVDEQLKLNYVRLLLGILRVTCVESMKGIVTEVKL